MPNHNWYRLDNSAIIYPMVITEKAQSLFRLSVALKAEVDPALLHVALNTALTRYPFYKVELKHGLFRPFLDDNHRFPIVEEDNGVLLPILNFRHNRHYLFRITYFRNKIFIDFFHGLCDGSGGMEFLKTILYYYQKASDLPIPRDNIRTLSTPAATGETEDAFLKYYKKVNVRASAKKMAGGSAFKIPGKQFKNPGFGLIQMEAPADVLLTLAKSYGVTFTVFLAAFTLYCVQKEFGNETKQTAPLVGFIPINLRNKFPSETLGNFTNFAKCKIDPADTPLTLPDYIAVMQTEMKRELSMEELQEKVSFASLMDKLPLLRYMPTGLKAFISRLSRMLSVKSKQTVIISNLGVIKLGANDVVDYFAFNLNCNKKTPNNLAVASYGNKSVFSFTRNLIDTRLERRFARELSALGVPLKVVSNLREDADVL